MSVDLIKQNDMLNYESNDEFFDDSTIMAEEMGNECEDKINNIDHFGPLDSDDIKFGEIFLSNKCAKLYFICYFCCKSYYKINDYIHHCVEDHNIDAWIVFNFLQDKNKTERVLTKKEPENVIHQYKRIENKKVKPISEHDHTYDKRKSTLFLDPKQDLDLCSDGDASEISNNKLQHNLDNSMEDIINEDLSGECEYLDEEFLEVEVKQTNDIMKSKDFEIEDSDDSTDFEDPADLTKIKRCRHCLTKVINFKLHMRLKHLDLLHKCQIPSCYEMFLTEKRMQEHIALIHRDPEKPFACKNCNYKSKKRTHLDTHFKRIHLNIKNKKCSYCEKTFYDSGELNKHERIHTGERPAICYICGKGWRTTQDLNKHILKHHEEPTFSCKVCEKKFHLKETMIRHTFVHSTERPNICHVCGKRFKHVKYLRGHMDLHSGIKKYECKICGKKFAQKNNYTGHQKIHNRSKKS